MKRLMIPLLLALAPPAFAQTDETPGSKQIVEIYRIAPGRQQAFLELIARCDEANRIAGLPPRQLFVHTDGEGWDFMLLQPAETPKDKQAALDAAWTKLGLPQGANFFLAIRQFIAEHSDTLVSGPTTAKAFLAGVSPPK